MPSVVRIFSDEESAIQISIDLAATLSGSPGPVGLVDHPPGAHAQSIGRIVYQWRDCMFLLDRRPFLPNAGPKSKLDYLRIVCSEA